MGSEQHYSLRWNDYTVKIVTAFQSLRDEEDFVDVTVACDGHSYSAHKMVLSACSPYFRALLRANPCQHPIVILKDVGHVELERLLEFMYNGEVSIAQDQLAAFLRTAENLKIRGLAGSSDDMDPLGLQRPDVSYSYSSCSLGAAGGTSGRSSPSAGYAPSQTSKDEEVGGDGSGGYHTRAESPPSKRRKRSSAPAASHADSNTATTECVVEASVEVDSGGSVSGNLPGEDDVRLDPKGMKSEPGDVIADVYSEAAAELDATVHTGEGLDPRHSILYPLALPGPSGAAGQDNVGPHDSGGGDGVGECRVKQEIGEEQWWGEPGFHDGDDGTGEEHLKQPISSPSVTSSPPTSTTAPFNITISSLGVLDGGEGKGGGGSCNSGRERKEGAGGVNATWTPFSPSVVAPLSHLETFAQSSFTGESSVVGSGEITFRNNTALSNKDQHWFSCTQCGKGFRTRVTLSRHEKIHTGKAFPCPICPKVFYQVSNVKYHVHAVHGQKYEPPPRIHLSL